MKKILHPASTRGTADYGWLKANYSFSFGNFFDPDRVQFGMLRVLNDDHIAPAMGFGKHPHKDMEIITIPQEGALKHMDSMGHSEVIHSGEIQLMSAGKGVEHSEQNASTTEACELFQIWVFPENNGVDPRYQQRKISSLINPNELTTIIYPKDKAGKDDLWIHQQAYFSLGKFNERTTTTYSLYNKNHGVYVYVINGSIVSENQRLESRDALGVWETESIALTAEKDSQVLLIEVPMN